MAVDQDGALSTLVERVEKQVDAGDGISLGEIQAIAGRRSAGPMLLFPALVAISPLSIIPGLPTMVGLNTILVAGQIVLGRDNIWLPKWLSQRQLSAKHARKLLKFLGPISRATDEVVRERAGWLTGSAMRRVGAVVCVLVGLIMPLLEVIPFTTTWAASIVAVYALAITARDGFLAIAWVGFVMAVLGVAVYLLT